MKNIMEGNDFGQELLLKETQEYLEIQNSIHDRTPWVSNLQVTKNSISGADAEIISYGQKVILKTKDGDNIEISADDMQLAQIIVHLLPYHEESIMSNLN